MTDATLEYKANPYHNSEPTSNCDLYRVWFHCFQNRARGPSPARTRRPYTQTPPSIASVTKWPKSPNQAFRSVSLSFGAWMDTFSHHCWRSELWKQKAHIDLTRGRLRLEKSTKNGCLEWACFGSCLIRFFGLMRTPYVTMYWTVTHWARSGPSHDKAWKHVWQSQSIYSTRSDGHTCDQCFCVKNLF